MWHVGGQPKALFKDSHTLASLRSYLCVFMWHLQVAAATTPTIPREPGSLLFRFSNEIETLHSEKNNRKRAGEREKATERENGGGFFTEKRKSHILRFGKCILHPSAKETASLMPLQIVRQSVLRVKTFRLLNSALVLRTFQNFPALVLRK